MHLCTLLHGAERHLSGQRTCFLWFISSKTGNSIHPFHTGGSLAYHVRMIWGSAACILFLYPQSQSERKYFAYTDAFYIFLVIYKDGDSNITLRGIGNNILNKSNEDWRNSNKNQLNIWSGLILSSPDSAQSQRKVEDNRIDWYL